MRSVIFALLAAGTAATPALAQESAPFTGARVEGIVGWDRLQVSGDHDDGVLYGIAGGFDFQSGGLLIGIEGEANDSSIKECVGARTGADPRICIALGRDLYAGGRIGTVIGGSTLLYAKGGYTNARAKGSVDDGTVRISDSTNVDGFRVGAGAEYAVGPNSFVKAEYRYSNYEQDLSRHQVVAGFGFRF